MMRHFQQQKNRKLLKRTCSTKLTELMVWTVYCIGQNKSQRRGGGKEGNEKSDGDKKKIDNYKKNNLSTLTFIFIFVY